MGKKSIGKNYFQTSHRAQSTLKSKKKIKNYFKKSLENMLSN